MRSAKRPLSIRRWRFPIANPVRFVQSNLTDCDRFIPVNQRFSRPQTMSSRRVLKAAQAIREVVSMAIISDLKDPRIR